MVGDSRVGAAALPPLSAPPSCAGQPRTMSWQPSSRRTEKSKVASRVGSSCGRRSKRSGKKLDHVASVRTRGGFPCAAWIYEGPYSICEGPYSQPAFGSSLLVPITLYLRGGGSSCWPSAKIPRPDPAPGVILGTSCGGLGVWEFRPPLKRERRGLQRE